MDCLLKKHITYRVTCRYSVTDATMYEHRWYVYIGMLRDGNYQSELVSES